MFKDIFIHGFGHGSYNIKLWGYIDNKGNVIIEPKYYELSYFNDKGYAYGIQLVEKNGYNDQNNEGYIDLNDFINNHTEMFAGLYNKRVVYYRIDKNGQEEEISKMEYYKNCTIGPDKKDDNIIIKENLDKKININIEDILLESIIPLIITLVAIIIIKKIIKKEEKNDIANFK